MNDTLTWTRDFLDEIEQTRVERGVLLWALGGPSFALRTPHSLIWIDPYLGGTPPDSPAGLHRAVAIPIDAELIREADVVLSTHEHIDHCHRETLLPIQAHTQAQFVGPAASTRAMLDYGIVDDRIVTVETGTQLTMGDVRLSVFATDDPAAHGPVGYVVECEGVKLFFAGDTQDTPLLDAVSAAHRLDVAVLAYGVPWYLSAENLLRAGRRLQPRLLIPCHWEIWRAFSGDLGQLFEAYYAAPPPFSLRMLQVGDRLVLEPQSP